MANSLPDQPRAGIDYPRTLIEFGEFFPDELACVAYLERLRWAEGFVCPAGRGERAVSEYGLYVTYGRRVAGAILMLEEG